MQTADSRLTHTTTTIVHSCNKHVISASSPILTKSLVACFYRFFSRLAYLIIPVMDPLTGQPGAASRPDDIVKLSQASLVVIKSAVAKICGMLVEKAGFEDLEQVLKSLQAVLEQVRLQAEGFSRIQDSARRHACRVIAACQDVVAEVDNAIDARGSDATIQQRLEALQSTLSAYGSALNLALEVVNM
jgi:hypothetical protein